MPDIFSSNPSLLCGYVLLCKSYSYEPLRKKQPVRGAVLRRWRKRSASFLPRCFCKIELSSISEVTRVSWLTGHRPSWACWHKLRFFLPYRSIIILYIYMLNFLKQSHHFDCTRHVVWCFKFCWGRLCLIIHCYISYHRAIGDPHSTCLHCSQEPPFSNHAFYGWRSTNFTNWKKLCQTCFRRRILFLECKAWTYGMLVYIPVPWSIWDYSNISYPTIHERGKNWLYSVPKKRIASAVQLWSFLIWQSWCRYCEDVFVSCCIVTQPVANHMSI